MGPHSDHTWGGSGEVLDGTLGATFSDSLLADVLLSSEDEQVDDEEHEEVDDEEEHVREVEEQELEEGFGGDLDALQQLLKEKDGIIQSSTRLAKAQIDRLTEELHAERKYVLPPTFFFKKRSFSKWKLILFV